MKRILNLILISLLCLTPFAAEANFVRATINRVVPTVRNLKISLPSLYWYLSTVKTGFKVGLISGVAAAPGLKFYKEKKSIKERYKLAKDEFSEQTTFAKDHFICFAQRMKHYFIDKRYDPLARDGHIFLYARK